jgi:drug/metabolite transporter (DMT)-like permease
MTHGVNRALATLLGLAVAGVLLWLAAAHVDRHTTGGYWAAYALVAAAGLAVAVTQLRGGGNPAATTAFVFLPVLVVVGWVIVALQPHANAPRGHVLNWSGDLGILDVVRAVGTWLGVLAFGFGYTLGLALEPPVFRRRREVAVEPVAADAPTTAERREVVEEEPVTRRHTAPR